MGQNAAGDKYSVDNSRKRKVYSFPQKDIMCRIDGVAFFKCPFCQSQNEINENVFCKHVVYVHETVNNLAIYLNDTFFNILTDLVSATPEKYIDDFEDLAERYFGYSADEYGNPPHLSFKEMTAILEDRLSPDVIKRVFADIGIPDYFGSFCEYSLEEPYIDGGTYVYLLSDDDQKQMNRVECH